MCGGVKGARVSSFFAAQGGRAKAGVGPRPSTARVETARRHPRVSAETAGHRWRYAGGVGFSVPGTAPLVGSPVGRMPRCCAPAGSTASPRLGRLRSRSASACSELLGADRRPSPTRVPRPSRVVRPCGPSARGAQRRGLDHLRPLRVLPYARGRPQRVGDEVPIRLIAGRRRPVRARRRSRAADPRGRQAISGS